jgi:hypothetical protein
VRNKKDKPYSYAPCENSGAVSVDLVSVWVLIKRKFEGEKKKKTSSPECWIYSEAVSLTCESTTDSEEGGLLFSDWVDYYFLLKNGSEQMKKK